MDSALKELYELSKSRRVKHIWKYQYNGDSILSALDSLTKDDLNAIKNSLSLPVNSNLKKDDFLLEIKRYILVYLEEYISLFTEEHFNDLQHILDDGKSLTEDLDLIDYFFKAGIIYPVIKDNEKTLFIPTEIKKIITDIKVKNVIQKNTEIIDVITGLLEYYGVIKTLDLWNIIQLFYPDYFKDYLLFSKFIKISADSNFPFNMNAFFTYDLRLEVEDVYDIHREQLSKNIDYYPFDKLKALQV